jgi:AraC family transcriptional regulator, transcriptional activator FtrA
MISTPHRVVALVIDQVSLFELGIAAELFGLPRPELEVPWYTFHIANIGVTPCKGLGGVALTSEHGLSALTRANTIVITNWNAATTPSPALVRTLRAAHKRGVRFFSICSGAFLLAHAGLLRGRRATTHWRYTDVLRAQFPEVEVVPDVLYVDDGQIITSAGSAAGIDAGLHLIRRDYGAAIANNVARRMVVTPHRDGGQRQFIPAPIDAGNNAQFAKVIAWALARLDKPITVDDLAAHAAMSPRNFLRRFSEHTGTTPKAWLQRQRIARAQELIERGKLPMERVAERSGFASAETFRVVFRKQVGVAPTVYRQRFT